MAVAPQKRYFELARNNLSRFWEVSLDGITVTVRYGRVGEAGQRKTRKFADAGAAGKYAEKVAAEKLSKGYVESVEPDFRESPKASDATTLFTSQRASEVAVTGTSAPNLVIDTEREFEQAVRERLASMTRADLKEAWQADDIGLAQWVALPLEFRLHRAAGGFWSEQGEAVLRLITSLGWTHAKVRAHFPHFDGWSTLASSPSTPESVLNALSEDLSSDVRRSVAANPNATGSLLSTLSNDRDPTVRGDVAWNPKTPPQVLEKLAKDSVTAVRSIVAENPNTPESALVVLGDEVSRSVRCGVAANSGTPEFVLRQLSQETDTQVRQALARNRHAPLPTLNELALDGDVQVRETVARNPSSSSWALEALSRDQQISVRVAVARNPGCPGYVIEGLANDAEFQVQDAIAQNQASPDYVLEAIYWVAGRSVHWELARNPSTPTKVLELLSRHDDPWIQAKVAWNSALPESRRRDLLSDLSKLPSVEDRKAAAGNPATSDAVLRALSMDKKMSVRCAVASNPVCLPAVLSRLASDGFAVQDAVARHQKTPLGTLVQLSASKHPQVRKSLALHAHRSPELRHKLWTDPDAGVRSATASCPGLDSAMLDELLQGSQNEGDLLALFVHPSLSVVTAQTIARKLFTTRAEQSPWFLQEIAKAKGDIRAAARAAKLLSYFGKDPNKSVLAKRPMAAVMALCAGPYIEPTRIARVARSNDWLVRAAVAQNQGTPPSLCKRLSRDAHPLVSALARRSLARLESGSVRPDSGTSDSMYLERAAAEIQQRLRGERYGWTVTPILNSAAWRDRAHLDEVLSWLKRFDEFDSILTSLLAQLDEAQRAQFWLFGASASDSEVRMRLVQHPAIPSVAIERFSNDQSAAVLIALACKETLPTALRSRVEKSALGAIKRLGVKFRAQMAIHAATAPAFVQERLLRDDYQVRRLLRSPTVFPDWMTQVRYTSRTTSADQRVNGPVLEARVDPGAVVGSRRQTLEDWVNCLRESFHRRILLHQGKPPAPAVELAAADVISALAWLGCIPMSDQEAPTKASRSSDWLTRLGAVLHPATTEEILNLLRLDADPDVGAAAQLCINRRATTQQTNRILV